jgi:hypothetical protein
MMYQSNPLLQTAPGRSDYRTWNWRQIDELFVHSDHNANHWHTAPDRVLVYVVHDAETGFRAGLQVYESQQPGGPFHLLLTRRLPHSIQITHRGLEECFHHIERHVVATYSFDRNPIQITAHDDYILSLDGYMLQRTTEMALQPRNSQDIQGHFMMPLGYSTDTGEVIIGSLVAQGPSSQQPLRPDLIELTSVVAFNPSSLNEVTHETLSQLAVESALQWIAGIFWLHYSWHGTFKVGKELQMRAGRYLQVALWHFHPEDDSWHHVPFSHHATAAGHMV